MDYRSKQVTRMLSFAIALFLELGVRTAARTQYVSPMGALPVKGRIRPSVATQQQFIEDVLNTGRWGAFRDLKSTQSKSEIEATTNGQGSETASIRRKKCFWLHLLPATEHSPGIGLDQLSNLRTIVATGTDSDDRCLLIVPRVEKITGLDLRQTNISYQGIAQLEKCCLAVP